MSTFDSVTIKATSLGRMLDPVPHWFRRDTSVVLDPRSPVAYRELGHPWIESPIFDRLVGERFGK